MKFRKAIFFTILLIGFNCASVFAATKATNIEFLLTQARNATGSLAGGTVTVAAAGDSTNTPITIWLDRNKATPAANPYTLDSNGTAQLYADGLIKVVIKNAAGTTIYTRDNLNYVDYQTSAVDSDYASLNAAITDIGSTPTTLIIRKVGFPTTGAYVVPSTLALKIEYPGSIANSTNAGTINGLFNAENYQVFTGSGTITGLKEVRPEWFGAVADDATDCYAAFVAANATGAPIKVQSGTYKIVGALTLDVDLIGTGWGSGSSQTTTLKFYNCTDTTKGAISTRIASKKANFIRIENVAIEASSWDGTTGALGYGLDVEAPVLARNVRVYGFKLSGIFTHGDAVGAGPYQSLFENVKSQHNGQHGFLLGTLSNTVTLINYEGKWNGAPSYGTAPSVAGLYDGFHVEYNNAGNPGGVYYSFVPEGVTILGGDCSYNSGYGWNFLTIHNSFLSPGYAEFNLHAAPGQINIETEFMNNEIHVQQVEGGIAGVNLGSDYYLRENVIIIEGINYGSGNTNTAPQYNFGINNLDNYLSEDSGKTNSVHIVPNLTTGSATLSTFGTATFKLDGAILLTTKTAANLGAATTAGQLIYCTDCTTAATCVTGGTGHLATANGTAWTCQ